MHHHSPPGNRPALRAAGLALLLAGSGLAAQALTVATPSSYDMPNGYGVAHEGSFNYWDLAYSGSGNTRQDFAPLTGGLGDLTDGLIATQRWDQTENLEGSGPYVGWAVLDPVITFHFAAPQQFRRVSIWHDDANGYGNVATPLGFVLTVGGRSQRFDIADPAGDAPFASVLDLPAGFIGQSLQLQVLRRDTATMLSEVRFEVSPVPEPGTLGLWSAGLAALLGGVRRLRSRS